MNKTVIAAIAGILSTSAPTAAQSNSMGSYIAIAPTRIVSVGNGIEYQLDRENVYASRDNQGVFIYEQNDERNATAYFERNGELRFVAKIEVPTRSNRTDLAGEVERFFETLIQEREEGDCDVLRGRLAREVITLYLINPESGETQICQFEDRGANSIGPTPDREVAGYDDARGVFEGGRSQTEACRHAYSRLQERIARIQEVHIYDE